MASIVPFHMQIEDSLTKIHGRYRAHGNLGKEYSQLTWIIEDSLTNFHGRYRAHGNLGKEYFQLTWGIEDPFRSHFG